MASNTDTVVDKIWIVCRMAGADTLGRVKDIAETRGTVVGGVNVLFEAFGYLMAGGAFGRCVMAVEIAVFIPIYSRLVACLADTLSGAGRVDIPADLAGRIKQGRVEELDIPLLGSV